MAEFTEDSQVRDVLARGGQQAKELLWKHGYQVGEGFVDVLSQHQSLLEASRAGRLRHLDELLRELNQGGAGEQPADEKSDVPIA